LTASVSQLPASSNRLFSPDALACHWTTLLPSLPMRSEPSSESLLLNSAHLILCHLGQWSLKNISYTMAPVIAAMCNASITENKFPVGQKCALVCPLLKKPTLDPLDLNSYRPISNLTFVRTTRPSVEDRSSYDTGSVRFATGTGSATD